MNTKRISKHDYYLNIAKAVSLRSTCLKRQYGAVIVKNDEIVSTGYNGSARGDINCCDVHTECPRKNKAHNSGDYGDCPAVHAEQNALLSAARTDTIDATLYLFGNEYGEDGSLHPINSVEPCPICNRMIRNAGIKQLVTPNAIKDYK